MAYIMPSPVGGVSQNSRSKPVTSDWSVTKSGVSWKRLIPVAGSREAIRLSSVTFTKSVTPTAKIVTPLCRASSASGMVRDLLSLDSPSVSTMARLGAWGRSPLIIYIVEKVAKH